MDSLSQAVLGAAVVVAVMHRRTAVWKAAAWGAVAGTLPDLDVFIDHGDAALNMVLHRGWTHALWWLTLISLPCAWAVATLQAEWALWKRWWLAVWLALITHPLLDAMTVYGTRLLLPFDDHPWGVGSMFIIDPLYTLPLLMGVAAALRWPRRGLQLNAWGLILSTAYLGWSAAAQHHVQQVAQASLRAQGIAHHQVLVTPAPFNTLLWRVVTMDAGAYHEGFYGLLDPDRQIRFQRHDRGAALDAEVAGIDRIQRIRRFSQGFFALKEDAGRISICDLRMGQHPYFVFCFEAAQRQAGRVEAAVIKAQGRRADLSTALPWLWRRMGGERLAPPS